jgi:hypothetical protein
MSVSICKNRYLSFVAGSVVKGKPHTKVGVGLEAFRPAAGAVVHAGDFDACAAHAVGDDIRRFGDDPLVRAGDAAGRAELRVLCEELEDVQGDALGSCRIMLGDVGAKQRGKRNGGGSGYETAQANDRL